jgi:uncharacterized membrane protein
MNYVEFLIHLNDDAIVEAIREAELRTSGEIRVYIAKENASDPMPAAIAQFERMGMTQTQERNGVLIFVAPKSQTFAIIGDEGVHRYVGQEFWNEVSEEMRSRFRDDPTAAITHAVARASVHLARHFPRRADDKNELPDAVERG